MRESTETTRITCVHPKQASLRLCRLCLTHVILTSDSYVSRSKTQDVGITSYMFSEVSTIRSDMFTK